MTVIELKAELEKFIGDEEEDLDVKFYYDNKLHDVREITPCVANIDYDYETENVVIFSNGYYNDINTIIKER